ncbi:MAG: alpha/beta fold hydrolase, partial [Ignavibacteriales bacterium]
MAQVTSNGIRINYDDLGQGEPALLLMPGWCANRTVFQDLAPRCSVRHRTLVLDWRGHVESGPPSGDFGYDGLAEDALAVIKASGAQQVVPVALAHAGWVAIELRCRLEERIPKLVLLDWIIMEAPASFLEVLQGMQSLERWRETVEQIFSLWLQGVDNPRLIRFVREEMGSYGFEMWSRAAREISAAYAEAGSPLQLLSALEPPVLVLHLYAQPEDPGYRAAQQSFGTTHPWFHVRKVEARSHFPMFEVPEEIAAAIEEF